MVVGVWVGTFDASTSSLFLVSFKNLDFEILQQMRMIRSVQTYPQN